jgi:adenylosuccinate lyase
VIDRYSRPTFKELWSDAARFQHWLTVELAVCRAMEAKGTVPAGTAKAVEAKASGKLSAARILEIEETTRHDVIAFLTHVEELAGDPARWLHLGLTSSDVLDSALALQTRDALDAILRELDGLLASLKRRAEELKNVPCMGRSHGVHAEPVTAGLVFARWYAELARAKNRVVRAKERVSAGKLAGAVGTYANIDPEIEGAVFREIGLRAEVAPSQVVARDRHAEVLTALAFVGAAIEQIALGVRHWQRTEVGEAEEGFTSGQKGSSAMPHKKNPILSENLTGLSRLLRAYAGAAYENIPLWHERDISHSSVERVSLPDATILCDFMVARARGLVDGLVIHGERMRENIELSQGLCFSEAVLLELVKKGKPRQRAYEMVQRCALAARDRKRPFFETLREDAELSKLLSEDELAQCFRLEHHLRHVDGIVRRALSSEGELA